MDTGHLPVDELHLDDNQRIRAFTLSERISVGDPQCDLVVDVLLDQPVDRRQHSAMDRSHLFGNTRPGGLEYSRRVQEAGPPWLRARRWRTSVGVVTASLFTKTLNVGMLTVVIAHVRRSRLPMAPADPTEAAAPASDDAFIESASVSFFYGESNIGIFDFVDFSEQGAESTVGLDGAPQYRVRLMRAESVPSNVSLEKFNLFYLTAVREDLEVLWDDVLLKTNEHMRQAEAATRRRCEWQQDVRDDCQAAARRKPTRRFLVGARSGND
jgi:hypothetical protein